MMKKYKIVQHQTMGRIIIATAHYVQNELICVGQRTGIASVRDTHSFQIGDQDHVYLDEPAKLFSHSCEPNVYIMDNDGGGYNFYAVRDINSGEILAFHYGMSEAKSISVSVCYCNNNSCIGKSIGFKEAYPHLQTYLYRLGIANYLRKWYESKMHRSV